ncbi:MAG: glycosyltransferase [Treponema sp.]|jgi:glycosyltransferase involved in cell wall biosynthesis|nr:glycosyltransferase [Treponema sp.]
MTVVHVLEPFSSGVTTAVINITKQLPAIRHVVVHGCRMWVDAMENVKAKFPEGVSFIKWSRAGREINLIRDAQALWELIRLLKPYKAPETVIHLHSSKAGFLGRAACKALGISAVLYTPHCGAFIRTDVPPLRRKFFRLLERVGGWFGGTVVGCGESEAALYRQLGKPVLWVPNGVEITSAGKDPAPSLISFAGIAGIQKNPALFNRIALFFQDEALPFYWIGGGPLQGALTAQNITLTGWVDKAEVDAYLYKTLIYLSTSSWEGLPFGVLEAMNASCALLLSDVPGNRDLVIPGKNGYLFHDEDEAAGLIKKMLDHRQETLDMGRKSRELAESRYSAEKMGREYGKIYAAVGRGK